MPEPKNIDAEYELGRKAFADGKSLRVIVEQLQATGSDTEEADNRGMSFALGYADALVAAVRAAVVIKP